MAVDLRGRTPREVLGPPGSRAVGRDVALVFALALAVRSGTVLLSSGGYRGNFGYDGSVYYAAADALTFGRLPYSEFILLHPPAVMLALTPFAAVGRLIGDHFAFMAATVAFQVLGATNAALTVLVAGRLGLTRGAAVLGGLFYASWYGAVGAEFGIRLEPLGTLGFLLALLAFVTDTNRVARGIGRRRDLVLAGVALGAAVSTKIWWFAPAAVVILWQFANERRGAARLVAGMAAGLVVINGVFVVRDPMAAFQRIVLDQIGRSRSAKSLVDRVEQLASLHRALLGAAPLTVRLVLLALASLFSLGLVCAWRVPHARLPALVLAVQAAVVLLAPSFFDFYSGYLAASSSIVLASAAHHGFGGHGVKTVKALAVAVIGACSVATIVQIAGVRSAVAPFPGGRLAAGVRESRCVMADSPMALIELNALSRGLANGCANWIDVTGRTYGTDKASPPVSRKDNTRWQIDLLRYLQSGDAAILIRAGTGPSAGTLHTIASYPVITRAGRYTIYRTRPATASPR